ncbi:MAG: hydrogenase iron-sulfur subunit [Anaerolineae bacterium]
MVDAARQPLIEVMTYSEVERVDGYIGNFRAQVRKNPRYVMADRCNGCGACARVCPIEVPNPFELDIAPRKAIDVPHGQAVPLVYQLDIENCIKCYQCVDACGHLDAIDFSQEAETVDLDIGAVVVATGFESFDAARIPEFGYNSYPNVITAMELERLANSAGPTVGHLVRPSDGKFPHSLAIIQCVGSRDKRFNEYCSGFCCMYSIKNALYLKQAHPEMDVSIFYMDIRTPSKGYEEFYNRARQMGIRFIQGRPSQVTEDPETHNLFVEVEDQALGQVIEMEAEMVCLAAAAVPRADSEHVASMLTLSRSPGGFYMEYHPKLRPVDSPTDGIFLAGAIQGPKDIPASVAQGSAAASRAARVLSKDTWEIEPIVARVEAERCISAQGKKCGICAKACPYGAITVEQGYAAVVTPAKCHGCGGCVAECPHDAISQDHFTDAQVVAQLAALLKDKPQEKILAFMCHWCSYGGADNAGTSHFEYPASSRGVRVMCSARMDQDFILDAFRRGAGMVLVSGCHPQDCHYITGQQVAAKRFERIPRTLERLGINPERFRVEWISAAEGDKYARVITEMDAKLKSMDKDQIIAETVHALPEINNRLKRWQSTPFMADLLLELEAERVP